jgi:hypothetical protein
MIEYKKNTSTNLITVYKPYLARNRVIIPSVLSKKDFIEYYYYIYSVKILSKTTIEIKFIDDKQISIGQKVFPELSGFKRLAIPQYNRVTINYINIHIPQSIIGKFRDPYWEMNYIGNKTIYLKQLNVDMYIKKIMEVKSNEKGK